MIFKWRQTAPELIVCAVRWYLRCSLSLRDVEELINERGLEADHTTVWRWVQRYGPELEQRLRRHLKPTNKSWRVDETSYGQNTRADGIRHFSIVHHYCVRSQQVDLERIGDEQSGHMPALLLSIFRFVRLLLSGHQATAIEMPPCGCNSRLSSENVSDPF